MHMIFGNDQGVRLLEHVRLLERIRYDKYIDANGQYETHLISIFMNIN